MTDNRREIKMEKRREEKRREEKSVCKHQEQQFI